MDALGSIDKIEHEAACPVTMLPCCASNRTLIDIAAAVVDGHALLPKRPGPPG